LGAGFKIIAGSAPAYVSDDRIRIETNSLRFVETLRVEVFLSGLVVDAVRSKNSIGVFSPKNKVRGSKL
jgi:hypothetical protein